MSNDAAKVLFLMGPTASGKTSLAIDLYNALPVEIISVDSALVYRGLDIGTAKPSKSIIDEIPHHLIDICEPTETYSAGQFRQDASQIIDEIIARGKYPLLVGGTGLYFRSLEKGFSDLPTSNPLIRARLNEEFSQSGSINMHARLQKIDPGSASRIHENDPQRIQRALEIYEITGQSMSDLLAQGRHGGIPYETVKFIISPAERQVIHDRVEIRFKEMLELGLVKEVEEFYNRDDMDARLPSMRLVGYRQVWRYLNGDYDVDKMQERAIVASRQLAKRQLTWLRSESDTTWFDASDSGLFDKIMKFLSDSTKLCI